MASRDDFWLKLTPVLSREEQQCIKQHWSGKPSNLHEFVAYLQIAENRDRLSGACDLDPEKLLRAGAFARCCTMRLPGAELLRRLVVNDGWAELDPRPEPEPSNWLEAVLTWDQLRLVEYWSDSVWLREHKAQLVWRRPVGCWMVFFTFLALLVLFALVWTLRNDLFLPSGLDALPQLIGSRRQQDALTLLASAGQIAAIAWCSFLGMLLAWYLVRRARLSIMDQWLRLRGWAARYDLEQAPGRQERKHRGQNCLAWAWFFAFALAAAAFWSENLLAGFVLVAVGVGTWMGGNFVLEASYFNLLPASWMMDVRQRWARAEILRTVLGGLFAVWLVALWVPWTIDVAQNWAVIEHLRWTGSNAQEFDRGLDKLALSEEEHSEQLSWSSQQRSQVAGLLQDQIQNVDVVWEEIRWYFVMVVGAVVAIRLLFQLSVSMWGFGVWMILLSLALYAAVQYIPLWLEDLIPLPALWMQAALFSIILPFVLQVTADSYYASLESKRKQRCPSCEWPIPTGEGICIGCGRKIEEV